MTRSAHKQPQGGSPTRRWLPGRRSARQVLAAGAAVAVSTAGLALVPSVATSGEDVRSISLIHLADTHGKFVPRWDKLTTPDGGHRWDPNVGGFARTYTLVKRMQKRTEGRNLFLMTGDNFHGSAEMMFTKGRAGVEIFNTFAPDAYLPGNWDFAEGAPETRARFTGVPEGEKNATPDGKPLVTFPVVAAGVYNAQGAPAYATPPGTRLLKPYRITKVNGIKVAILGLNDDKPGEQGATFTVGLEMRAGFDEAPQLVREVRAKGAELVVALSEAGLAQNIALARDVRGIDVVFSGDTHEETFDPIRVPHRNGRETLVVESGEGSRVGRMDLRVAGRGATARVIDARWRLRVVDSSIPENPKMKEIVDRVRAPFLSGEQFKPHTRDYPGGGQPMTLDRPLDEVVGTAEVDLERHSVLPGPGDAFVAEALRRITGTDIAGTNGFRYDYPVPAGEDITVGDVYGWLPIGAHVAVGEMTGSQLLDRAEGFARSVLDPNPYLRGGGWMPTFAGVRFQIDLTGPHGPAGDRIVGAEVYNSENGKWEPLRPDRTYDIAGCYSAGDPLDRMCRTNGVRNMRFAVADPTGSVTLQKPLVQEMPPGGTLTTRVSPDGVVSAPEALLRFLDDNGGAKLGTLAPYSGPTWEIVAGRFPKSRLFPDAVQPLGGAGPYWMAAKRVR